LRVTVPAASAWLVWPAVVKRFETFCVVLCVLNVSAAIKQIIHGFCCVTCHTFAKNPKNFKIKNYKNRKLNKMFPVVHA
jgi:hypothetical protein